MRMMFGRQSPRRRLIGPTPRHAPLVIGSASQTAPGASPTTTSAAAPTLCQGPRDERGRSRDLDLKAIAAPHPTARPTSQPAVAVQRRLRPLNSGHGLDHRKHPMRTPSSVPAAEKRSTIGATRSMLCDVPTDPDSTVSSSGREVWSSALACLATRCCRRRSCATTAPQWERRLCRLRARSDRQARAGCDASAGL